MVFVAIEFHARHYVLQFFVYPYLQETFFRHLLEEFAIVALTISHERGEYVYALTCVGVQYHLRKLFLGISHHLLTCHPAVCRTSTSEKQAQVVIHLGRCAYGRTRILVGCLLFYGYDGGESSYLIYVRTLHASEKVSCVGRECLYVAPPSLGKDGVEGERRLARARQSRYDGQAIAWNLHVHVLEVVRSGTPYFYFFSLFDGRYPLPYTLLFILYTLYFIPYTLYFIPYTLYLILYTLYSLSTLNSQLSTFNPLTLN